MHPWAIWLNTEIESRYLIWYGKTNFVSKPALFKV